jgi:tricarballylate dehydrogenase
MANALGNVFGEGEEIWPKRYAIWGKLVAEQPLQAAYVILDSKAAGRYIPSLYPPLRAASIGELAGILGLDRAALGTTVEAFNRSIPRGEMFDPRVLDDCSTEGLDPPKSHWAQRIDIPPFFGYPLRPGVTFTYLGVQIDSEARLLQESGLPFENQFAAGECVSGNILSRVISQDCV